MKAGELLNIIEEIAEKENVTFKDISMKCNVDRSYLSKLVNGNPEKLLTDRMVKKISIKYPAYFFENNNNVPRATQKPQEPPHGDKSELLDIYRERVRELKEDKEWLKKNLEFSLTGIMVGNKSILAHVATILEKDIEREAGGNKKKEQLLKEDSDKRIGDKLSGFQQTDNSLSR